MCQDVMKIKYLIYIQAKTSTHWILLHYLDMIWLYIYNVMSKCFDTLEEMLSKPINFMTSNVLVLHVHVVVACCSHICNYMKGWTKF